MTAVWKGQVLREEARTTGMDALNEKADRGRKREREREWVEERERLETEGTEERERLKTDRVRVRDGGAARWRKLV